MTEYIYRVVDHNNEPFYLGESEIMDAEEAYDTAGFMTELAIKHCRAAHYRVQRAAVVWEDVDNA